jgi:thiamine-monophosphate kinase
MSHTPLGPGAEFDMIRSIWRRIGKRGTPSGDDCAFVEVDGVRLAISSDLSIEWTHFLVGWLDFPEIGWRAAVAGLSDLAAVAAEPLGVTVSIGASPELPEDHVADLMAGVAEAAEEVGAVVWGGDVVRSDSLVLDVTAVGRLKQEPVRRSGAQPGDALFVTGVLGGPAAALGAWSNGREPDAAARVRFARPHARVREARWLRDRGAHAMLDLSDGLWADAGHMAVASEVCCVIERDAVPVHPAADRAQALAGGEEYELLVALPEHDAAPSEFFDWFGLSLTRVGHVESGSGVRVESDDESLEPPDAFTHF